MRKMQMHNIRAFRGPMNDDDGDDDGDDDDDDDDGEVDDHDDDSANVNEYDNVAFFCRCPYFLGATP